MACSSCGSAIPIGARFCSNCGAAVTVGSPIPVELPALRVGTTWTQRDADKFLGQFQQRHAREGEKVLFLGNTERRRSVLVTSLRFMILDASARSLVESIYLDDIRVIRAVDNSDAVRLRHIVRGELVFRGFAREDLSSILQAVESGQRMAMGDNFDETLKQRASQVTVVERQTESAATGARAIVCPFCQVRGHVSVRYPEDIGGPWKLTKSLMSGGVLASRNKVLHCSNCGQKWDLGAVTRFNT